MGDKGHNPKYVSDRGYGGVWKPANSRGVNTGKFKAPKGHRKGGGGKGPTNKGSKGGGCDFCLVMVAAPYLVAVFLGGVAGGHYLL